jgi:imidazolonepropionase-like amidohydrolase
MQRSEQEQRREIAEDLESVEHFFDEAEAYIRAKDHDEQLDTDLRFEAMRESLSGQAPIFVNASSAGQIESAVAWASRRGYRLVIVGGFEADQVAALLAEHDVPVIIDGLHRLPGRRHYAPSQPFALPAKLHEAGVRFCIASGAEAAHERNLNHTAATAAAYGLPKEEALRAVTLNAATILGISEQYGSLEPNKSATLIVTTGDPLEITTDTLIAFIDGRDIDLGSRHKALYEKYQEKYRQLGLIDEGD